MNQQQQQPPQGSFTPQRVINPTSIHANSMPQLHHKIMHQTPNQAQINQIQNKMMFVLLFISFLFSLFYFLLSIK
jgi:hypothetical protein